MLNCVGKNHSSLGEWFVFALFIRGFVSLDQMF